MVECWYGQLPRIEAVFSPLTWWRWPVGASWPTPPLQFTSLLIQQTNVLWGVRKKGKQEFLNLFITLVAASNHPLFLPQARSGTVQSYCARALNFWLENVTKNLKTLVDCYAQSQFWSALLLSCTTLQWKFLVLLHLSHVQQSGPRLMCNRTWSHQ